MAAVTLEGVRKSFPASRREPAVVAVDALDLDVRSGELLALIGPSGCGKTTTLRLVAGLERPDAGAISLGGRPMNGVPPEDRDVAMVFQGGGLYPHLTVRENIAFPLRMRRGGARPSAADRRRAVEAVSDQLDLGSMLERRPGALSGGQRQRVALAKAIVREPACFLLDEPLASLDPARRHQLRSELKALHARIGRTVIHVTHDQEEAMALGDRLGVMRDGRLQQIGTPLEVYRRPANRAVAEIVGAPTMNFLDGEVSRAEGAAHLRSEGVTVPLPPAVADRIGDRARVVVGVRPESFVLAGPGAAPADSTLRIGAVVSMVEPLGDRADVHCVMQSSTSGRTLLVRTSAERTPELGEAVTLTTEGTTVHLFEATAYGGSIP